MTWARPSQLKRANGGFGEGCLAAFVGTERRLWAALLLHARYLGLADRGTYSKLRKISRETGAAERHVGGPHKLEVTIYATEYPAMSEDDRESFATLVAAGGAVKIDRVREGIQHHGVKLVVAKIGGKMIGCAALKSPADGYRAAFQTGKARYALPKDVYPHEVGYVAVHPDHERQGWGSRLCEMAMLLAGDDGVFATTGTASMLTRVLPRLGFKWVGVVWKGLPNHNDKKRPDLHLLVRPRIGGADNFAAHRPSGSFGKG